MTQITAVEVKKDNTNLFRYSVNLFTELRKTNFKKVKLDSFYQFLLVTNGGVTDPYPDADMKMVIETFASRLIPDHREVFNLFLLGLAPKEISERTTRSLPNVYYRLSILVDDFKKFYLKECM